ncbi:hypothetical protein WA026_006501 [Henosepilachna vigintioctopunctata]|uniref:Ig-like domain-containing protein n=1 Tax=Henosepilachna vigintioctopunctata TaxID=420089 RepID=A0AAW1U6Z0_9CUCU
MVVVCATKTPDWGFGIFFLIIFVSLLSGYASLRLTNMTAPVIQDPRDDMHLFCEFDMGGEELYAVKWYKDDHEFFRYSPAGNQRLLQFQVMGVHVDVSRTQCSMTSCNLLLNELSKTFSSGAYRCEVSTEAPAFRLASQTHNITVAGKVFIYPTKLNTRPGSTNIECSSNKLIYLTINIFI